MLRHSKNHKNCHFTISVTALVDEKPSTNKSKSSLRFDECAVYNFMNITLFYFNQKYMDYNKIFKYFY